MNHVNYFKELLESIQEYKKIILLLFLIQNDINLLTECGFVRNDLNRLSIEFLKKLKEQNEGYLDYIKNY